MSEVTGTPGEPGDGQQRIDRRALSRSRQYQLAVVASIVVLLLIGLVWGSRRLFAASDSAPVAAAPPPGTFRATATQMKTFTIESVVSHAFVSAESTEGKIAIDADRATPVYSPFSGRVLRVVAGLGDVLKAGAPLVTIEASEFVQAQNDLLTADAQVKLARSNESRKHALLEAKGGSLQDWQQAQADLSAAEATADAARNRLRILGKSASEIAAIEAEHGMNPVATLKAPISGVVVDRQVGPGQYLQAGSSTPVFTIADPSNVWLTANVREADAGAVRVGQAVEVHVLAYPQRIFKASLSYVAAVIDPTTHRLPVRAVIDNRDGALKPEMFATFRILTSGSNDALGVPEIAVVFEGDAAHVWVVAADNLISYRAVHVGRNNDGLLEVLDGLAAGERIVTHGALFIDQAAAPSGT